MTNTLFYGDNLSILSQHVGRQVQAMQIRTVGELLAGQHFEFPVTVGSNVSFKQAAAIAAASGQGGLDL